MNLKPDDPKERLLDEVLESESFREFNQGLKSKALAQFRQARRLRTLASISQWAAVIAALLAGFFYLQPRKEQAELPKAAPVIVENSKAPIPAVPENPTPEIRRLTDEELIASFPPHSCYIAEVDGHKVLVFYDPKVEKQYMQ